MARKRSSKSELKSPEPPKSVGLGARIARARAARPVLWFVVTFALCLGALFAVTLTAASDRFLWIPYLKLNARIAGVVLGWIGRDVSVAGQTLSSPAASLLIARGCDAIHPSALFISAVLASPVSIRSRLLGMFVGTSLLLLLNIVRIASLFVVKESYPAAFDVMHIEVWQFLFIVLALLLWVTWAVRAVRRAGASTDGAAS